MRPQSKGLRDEESTYGDLRSSTPTIATRRASRMTRPTQLQENLARWEFEQVGVNCQESDWTSKEEVGFAQKMAH